jgi:asparagine N-glycosylation enzyme membrane subunit Stt3
VTRCRVLCAVIATLPYGFKLLTWIGGSVVLVVLWASSFYCTMLLVRNEGGSCPLQRPEVD